MIVDNGNFCRASRRKEDIKTDYLARAMSMIGYDAINLGREEVILGPDRIRDLQNRERLPLVSSNVFHGDGDRTVVAPYLIKRVGGSRFLGFRHGGVKVAIVGLTNSVNRDRMGRAVPKELIIPEPEDILRATMERLSGRCDVVIVLSDLDLQEAIEMNRGVEGVDLFFVGLGAKEKHTERVGETIFIYPVRNGNELGDVELVLDEDGTVTSFETQWTLLDKSVPNDDELGQLIAEYKAEMSRRNKPPQPPSK